MNKLWIRLSLGFSGMVLAASFLVALAGIAAGRSDRFQPSQVPDRLVLALAQSYEREHDWTEAASLLRGADTILDRRRPNLNVIFFLADANRRIIYHPGPEQAGQPPADPNLNRLLPIQVEGQTVGYLGVAPNIHQAPDGPPDFIEFLGRTLLTMAAIAGGGGVIFGILMSRTLTAPLNRLAEAARAIGRRDLSRRVEEKGSAEMVAVARAFNEMAVDLEQAETLRRNLLADVAHELRTPLSVVQGNLRAILDEVYPLDPAEIARLYEQTRHLSRLINDLHELAQAEARQLPLNLETTDVTHLIKDTGDTFRPSAEAKGVALQTEFTAGIPPVLVDSARLQQVLLNLLANALRHTPAEGKITLRAESNGSKVCLSVMDTGEGIPPEHLPYIFDRFYRADPARTRDKGGAGLGLAIARAIVEAHGGTITAASEGKPGRGSVFTIRLPVPQPHAIS